MQSFCWLHYKSSYQHCAHNLTFLNALVRSYRESTLSSRSGEELRSYLNDAEGIDFDARGNFRVESFIVIIDKLTFQCQTA